MRRSLTTRHPTADISPPSLLHFHFHAAIFVLVFRFSNAASSRRSFTFDASPAIRFFASFSSMPPIDTLYFRLYFHCLAFATPRRRHRLRLSAFTPDTLYFADASSRRYYRHACRRRQPLQISRLFAFSMLPSSVRHFVAIF